MPIRVLFLNTRDQRGADVDVHLTLMRHFEPDQVEAHLISNSEASDALSMRSIAATMPRVAATFLPLGLPSEVLGGAGKAAKATSAGRFGRSLVAVAAYVRRRRIDLLHATDRPRDAMAVVLAARLARVPSLVHMHSSYGDHLSRPTLWGFRNASAIAGVSEFTCRGIVGMGFDPSKVHVLHNATDIGHFDPEGFVRSGKGVRARFAVPHEAPLLGIVARINPWKGQRESIAALARISGTYPDARLMVVGSGPASEGEALRGVARTEGVADRVVFAGRHDDVRPFLDAFDVFVHPSFEEPFGLAITEAMAMRKAVVACDSGALPEIISDGVDGLLVEPRSADAVARGVRRLLDSASERERIGDQARRTVAARFVPALQCAAAARLYGRILDAAGRRVPLAA